ncbi:MAG: hypothetical protein HYW06_09030 [Gemmatimonadetes bacterium]|nr:hypothetical protein [Gemmatimonadota bacterium]
MTRRALWFAARPITALRFAALPLAAVQLSSLAEVGHAQDYRTTSGSRQRRGETELRANVEFAVGELRIAPATAGTLYRFDLVYDAEHFDPVASYNPETHRLRVGVDGRGRGDLRYRDRDRWRQRLDLNLSPATPVSLDLAFGAGTADVELGGLSLSDVGVKAGASETTIRVSEPNRVTCRVFTLEVGAIDLKTEKLGNARCQRIKLKGGAASVVLDLTGQWIDGATSQVDIAVGLGSVTLRLPESVGVEADVERFLVNFDRSGLSRRGPNYYSANWDTAKTKLRINLKAALGDIAVEWVQ